MCGIIPIKMKTIEGVKSGASEFINNQKGQIIQLLQYLIDYHILV